MLRSANSAARQLCLLFITVGFLASIPIGCSRSDSNQASAWEKFEVVDTPSGTLQFRGLVEAQQRAVIENADDSILLQAFHADGDHVSAGDLLLQLDASELSVELAQKKEELAITTNILKAHLTVTVPRQRLQDTQELDRLEKEVEKASSALELEKHLLKVQKGDPQRVDQAQLELDRLIAMRNHLKELMRADEALNYGETAGSYRLKALELTAEIENLETRLEKCRIVAPLSGIIQAHQPLQPGPIAAGPVLTIFDPKTLVVRGKVWQNEFLQLQVGQKAMVYPDFLDKAQYPGYIAAKVPYGRKIKEISSGEEMSQFTVLVNLSGPSKELLTGMSVMVVVEPQTRGVQVPNAYIFKDGPEHYVLRQNGENAPERVRVTPEPGYQGFGIVAGVSTGDVLLKPVTSKP